MHSCTFLLSAAKQDNDGYVPQQLHMRLFQKIQDLQFKQQGTEAKEEKTLKKKTKGQASKVVQGTNDKNTKRSLQTAGSRTAEDEEKELRDAYEALLTEYHKRKAKRKQNPKNQNEQKQADKQNKVKQDEPIQDDFSHLRRKN